MTLKKGRPHKDDAKKIKLTLRLSENTSEKLRLCAEKLEMTRTEVIEKGIDMMCDQLPEK